ncbi:MAG: peptidase M1 [Deltaproteobacteria bacterium]|nr:peptidase M1 [Deltaproteobacteria bacterium]
MIRVIALAALALVACGGSSPSTPDAGPTPPTRDDHRDVLSTDLAIDLATQHGTATITLAPATTAGASFEIGDLDIDTVTSGGQPIPFATDGARIDLGVAPDAAPLTLEIAYRWHFHEAFDGISAGGFTFLWPYYCGNAFPCRSEPADGERFTLALTGVPTDAVAVYPHAIATDAPPYQVAWATGAYTRLDLGATTAGTTVGVWHLPGQDAKAAQGGAHLRDAFDWYERTLGPYRCGADVAGVAVPWGPGAFGGMEHHPYWHVGAGSLGDEVTEVHEAAHGWFGDGIRIACWEDFVLSEGTVTYLAARSLTEVAGATVGNAVWQSYATDLGSIAGTDPVWPDSCGAVDVLKDHLFSDAPYKRGAFFYKAVADRVGVDALDQALAAFYQAHAGGTARMQDMLDQIKTSTGFDPTACAAMWLRSTAIPTPGPCP